jgi:hypothetical protein
LSMVCTRHRACQNGIANPGILTEDDETLASSRLFTYTSRSWPPGQVFY